MKKTIRLTPLRAFLLLLTLLSAFWFFLFSAAELFKAAVLFGYFLLILIILFWPQIRGFLQQIRKNRGGRVLLMILSVLLSALLIWLLVLCCKVVRGMRQPESNAETVIVLGCQVKNGRPSQLLGHRIDAAADYLLAHPDAVCIVSGGQGANESISEAACMRQGLIERGVDEARILTEDRSTTTRENLLFSKELMAQHGLSAPALLVSNNFHLYRALRLADAVGVPAEGLAASCEWYMLPTYIFREALALMYHSVFR